MIEEEHGINFWTRVRLSSTPLGVYDEDIRLFSWLQRTHIKKNLPFGVKRCYNRYKVLLQRKENGMFQKDSYIMYGKIGICKIDDICTPDIGGLKGLYYVLSPMDNNGGKIYRAVDNTNILMREMITPKEANRILSILPEVEPVWVTDARARELAYKENLRSGDCEQWIKMLKGLYIRKEEMASISKKLNMADDRMCRTVEKLLVGELAMVLEESPEEIQKQLWKYDKKNSEMI